jgi:sensor histidine kinase YesM
MDTFLKRYHVKEGVLLAALLPGIFVFSGSSGWEALMRFILSFTVIIGLWLFNFSIIDFSAKWGKRVGTDHTSIPTQILISTLCAVGFYLVIGFIDTSHLLLSQIEGSLIRSPKAWFYLILRIALMNALVILIKYFYDFMEEKRRIEYQNEVLKRESAMAMHQSLKEQMNPHFLFNSLNTLKSLVKQDQGRSLDFIEELAAIYRYMLVNGDKSEVTVREEINFTKSYLNLLKIRFGQALLVDMDLPDHVMESKMPFNTLQTLMENAVKHNILSQRRPLKISVCVRGKHLVVTNNIQPKTGETSSSVGLSNVNKRFEILYGQTIIIDNSDGQFQVSLPIKPTR